MNDATNIRHQTDISKVDTLLAEVSKISERLERIEQHITSAPRKDRYDAKEAAAFLRVSTRKLADIVAKGELVPLRPGGAGGKRFFTREALDSHLKRSAD